ncbi:sugar phosphate isomerase/epimerase family protein [Propionimicrobium lymphophilum]|uniref:sugar phosphate isomerase/epimerase family protein n=1 Tax=Propionimicrobium lymphophilum TaxID=33012 RepID=UPI0023F242CA|nr:sugar phosphate isomerase/epimerase [Propionimicrobium lymphophilum]
MAFTLTGFADEIAHDLGEQIELLNKLDIKHVEFRSAWGTKVLDLDDEELKKAKKMLDENGIKLSSVGSDIGKIKITDPFEDHLKRAAHSVEVAKFFGSPYIRMFSFFMPEGEDPDSYRDEVLSRTRKMVKLAEAGGVTMLHENEKDIYGDIPRRVIDLITSIDSPNYRAIFDPANYVQCHVKPFDEAFEQVRPYTDYIHCKDAKADTMKLGVEEVVPCGEGDGQVCEVVAALNEDGYNGFFSIEPHLGQFDAFGGLCGPELWTKAYEALTGIFKEQGIEWN